ncbi:MAG: sirohydrochlorin cobaltochelatase [Candidatus Methanogranum gryphiswaldense]|nr:MAG: sirohydrochlorin cobaltochelatase [Candidatus Methanogranum sp. U3.2.1]
MIVKDKAILVVSFGTSYNENRKKTIGSIESSITKKYPDWEIRRAFTSKMIIEKLAKRDNEKIDYITNAMERLISDKVKTVIIQPTHIMNGMEYDDIVRAVSGYVRAFDTVLIGKPLLTTERDYDNTVKAIESTHIKEAKNIAGDRAAIILMGHGTEHYANATYSQLHLKLQIAGHTNIYVTTVEGFPTFDDTILLIEGKGYRNVVLFPFMLVAGDHANNDMAGDDENSLKSLLEKKGYDVHCVVKGLGEYKEFIDLFMVHIDDMVEKSTKASTMCKLNI